LDRDVFEAQIRYICKHYRIVSIDELADELHNPTSDRQAVAVTFDDGYRSCYSEAFPILRKYRIPATIYLTVDAVDSGVVSWYDRIFLALQLAAADTLQIPPTWPCRLDFRSVYTRLRTAEQIIRYLRSIPDERRVEACERLERQVSLPQTELEGHMLSWEQVREMQTENIGFGSHTLTHPVMSRLATTEAERQLRESKKILEERTGQPVRHFAYPFGQPADCGSLAATMLAPLGYRTAATTCLGANGAETNPYYLMRVAVAGSTSFELFAWHLNQLFIGPTKQCAGPKTLTVAPGLTDV
jgi:peptidoglycan/xylan/chitin deacetylase (PgdA/CDA1 family)